MPKVNDINKIITNKLTTNKNKIKINLKQIQQQFKELSEAGEKLIEKTNPPADKFVK